MQDELSCLIFEFTCYVFFNKTQNMRE